MRQLANNVTRLIRDLGESKIDNAATLLQRYAEALVPWARKTAMHMIGEVNDRERDSWRQLGTAISAQLHRDLRNAEIGNRVQELLGEQVELITSIPRQAGERAQELALKAVTQGERVAGVAEIIESTNRVTTARALLIARTETSRAATVLTQARSEAVGATHYIWRTAMDQDVRPGHAAMEGKVCEWANPPAVKEGERIMHFHPGAIWNCRCYPEPIIDDPYAPKVRGRRRR